METLCHKFIETLAAGRDRLFPLALARCGTPGAAEAALQQAAGEAFRRYVQNPALDIPGEIEKALGPAPAPPADAAVAPMPADVWARLAATVQIEASRSKHERALNPDSVLLRPDPLLAPKKAKPRSPDDEFDITSPSRLFTVLGAAVLVGVLVTIYLVARPASPAHPAPSTTATAPAATTTGAP